MTKQNIMIAYFLIFSAALMRLMPHWPNFVPTVGLAIFAGNVLGTRKVAYIIVFGSMLISDFLIGFYDIFWVTYLSLGFIVYLGTKIEQTVKSIVFGSLICSLIFFVVTNAAVWASGWLYPTTLAGLISCFTMALPFFGFSIAGDLFYTGCFFGLYSFLTRPAEVRIGVNK
ncbi:MAG: hypothetical protein IT292_02240 [Deltaproteobacteria bacterium]|nr:hypothetical protein [Deltaproteobacteria bacterium]